MEQRGYKYVLENGQPKCIGKGSFGRALLVTDKHAQVFVAKELNLKQMNKKDKRSSENEVRMLQQLDHPFIVKFVDSFVDKNEIMYIIMEYADGVDLSAKIKQQRRTRKYFSEDQVMLWFSQLALALDHLHEKKILHRDLKTMNVFLTSSNIVKLGDFGFSKRLKTAAMAHTICGTPYYFSPELCQGHPYSNKSDIWSLGVILFEMAMLSRPYEADSMQELMRKIVYGEYNNLGSHVPSKINRLICSLLAKKDTVRPSVTRILLNPYVQKYVNMLPALLTVKPTAERYPQVATALMKEKNNAQQEDKAQDIKQKIAAERLKREQNQQAKPSPTSSPVTATPPPPTTTTEEAPPQQPQQPQAVTEGEMGALQSQIHDLPQPKEEKEKEDAASSNADGGNQQEDEQEYSMIFEEYESDDEDDEGDGAPKKPSGDNDKKSRSTNKKRQNYKAHWALNS
eukprot:TRINITY_DN66304_c1_g1_i1.p1 TRINITY_DN66304_c1_g1~~TRINITY_DN66304_c1_g1_i1.p1  ORF type:complete len:455 (-),score=74.08 TRINITY_DN66304_c1_g1_i1:362-1726(-)